MTAMTEEEIDQELREIASEAVAHWRRERMPFPAHLVQLLEYLEMRKQAKVDRERHLARVNRAGA